MPTDNNYWNNPQGQGSSLESEAEKLQSPLTYQPEAGQQARVQQPLGQAQAMGQMNAQQLSQPQEQGQPQVQPEQQAQPQQRTYAQSANQQPAYAQTAGPAQTRTQPAGPQPPAQPFQAAPAYANAQPYYAVPVEQKKSRGWIVAIVIVACLFLLSLFAIKSCTDTMSSVGSMYGYSSSDVVTGDAIAVIDIDGTIQYDGSACSPEGLKELLDEAEADSNIKGVVLRVNSGGGTATAGEEMAEYVRAFSKPVVVSSAAINASAAYEISSQADYIYVAKSTEIGAIGTAMEVMDYSGLLGMLGISVDTIVSADQKDSSYGFRPLSEDERAYYQAMVDDINKVFIENVADGRHMTVDEVNALATGMPFTGVTAVENGIADAIGTREDAISKCAELAGITDYTTTSLSFTNYNLSDLAYLFGESREDAANLAKLLEATENGTIK